MFNKLLEYTGMQELESTSFIFSGRVVNLLSKDQTCKLDDDIQQFLGWPKVTFLTEDLATVSSSSKSHSKLRSSLKSPANAADKCALMTRQPMN